MNFDDIPIGAIAVALIIVAAAVALPMSLNDQGPAKKGTIEDHQNAPQVPTEPDSSLYRVPDEHTTTADAPEVRASAGSQTMQVSVQNGALVLADDDTHDGRWVSVSTEWLRTNAGRVPAIAHIQHSEGSEYASEVHVKDGDAVFYVRSFSTNTVTWSGSVEIGNTFADGSSVNYDISNLDAASDVTLNLTGKENSEWDNLTASGVSPSTTRSLSVGGNSQPTDGAGGNPILEVTGHDSPVTYNPVSDEGDRVTDSDLYLIGDNIEDVGNDAAVEIQPTESGSITSLDLDMVTTSGDGINPNVDIYIDTGEADSTYGEGTLVKTDWNPSFSTGTKGVTLDTPYDVTAGNKYEIEFRSESDNDGTSDFLEVRYDDSAGSTWMYKDTYAKSFYADIDVNIPKSVTGLSVSDGAGHSHTFGDFTDGETKSTTLDLSTSSTELNFQSDGNGQIDYSLTMQEKTVTQDSGVELNDGNWANHTGTLADGETVTKTINSSALVEGTNTINVSMPSLSADAPPMQVQVDYTHDAEDDQSIEYDAEKWSERYNVSKTYASDRTNPTLTIPFADTTFGMRDLEYRVNGGSWQTLSDYSLENSTLTANLPNATAGDTMTVRANASKVVVNNGSISVTSTTPMGQQLATSVQLNTWNADSYISVGGTPDGDEMHYVENASWSGEDYYTEHTSAGAQNIYLPNAVAGGTVDVHTLPVRVDALSGEARMHVITADSDAPEFEVSEGASPNDDVNYVYLNAETGEEWVLESVSGGMIRDSGVAESPVTLSDDDSAETLLIRLAESTDGGGGGGGDSGTGIIANPTSGLSGTGDAPWLALIAVFAALGALVVVSRNDDAVTNAGAGASDAVENSLGGVPVVGPVVGQGLAGIVRSLSQFANAALRNKTITYSLMVAIGLGAVQANIIQLPAGSLVFVSVGLVSLGSLLALREFDEYSNERWVGIVVATTVVALQTMSDESLLTSIVESQLWPIIAIGGLYLAWSGVKALRQPDQVNEIIIRGDDEEDNN